MQESAGGQIVPDGDEEKLSVLRREELARRATSIEPDVFSTDIEVDMSRAERLPLGQLAALGVGFGSLPEAVRTVTSTTQIAGGQLLSVTDKLGNPLNASVLQAFKDGSGIMGSFRDPIKGFGQARFHLAGPKTVTTALTVPFDPTSLFMAAVLMEINRRLDDIQQTQREMFDYLKNKDKAQLRGDLETLRDILDNYRFNWDNEKYKTNKHALVQSIRNEASQAVSQQRAEIKGSFKKAALPFHVDDDARHKARDVRAKLEEYRLSVYLYAYSSFLEVMLLENFESGYLENVKNKVEDKALDYRTLYTKAYSLIEAEADSSVQAGVLGGISGAMGILGKALENTPVGDVTPIDEALIDAGKSIDRFSREVKRDILRDLPDACSSDVRPFVSGIEAIDHLYNDDVMLLADSETVYILPAEAASFGAGQGKAKEKQDEGQR